MKVQSTLFPVTILLKTVRKEREKIKLTKHSLWNENKYIYSFDLAIHKQFIIINVKIIRFWQCFEWFRKLLTSKIWQKKLLFFFSVFTIIVFDYSQLILCAVAFNSWLRNNIKQNKKWKKKNKKWKKYNNSCLQTHLPVNSNSIILHKRRQ